MNRLLALLLILFCCKTSATECPETNNGFDPKVHFQYANDVFLGYISEGYYDLKGWEQATSQGVMYIPSYNLNFGILKGFKGKTDGTLKVKAIDQGFHDGWRIGDLYLVFLSGSTISVCTKVTPLYTEYFNEFQPIEDLKFMLERADVTQRTKHDIEFLLTPKASEP